MLDIAYPIWDGQGRPDPFNRSIAVAETGPISVILDNYKYVKYKIHLIRIRYLTFFRAPA